MLLGMPSLPTSPRGTGHLRGDESFPDAARKSLTDSQLRRNLGKATGTIRAKRAAVVAELPDWEELREAGRQLKVHTMAHLPDYLVQLEEAVTAFRAYASGDRPLPAYGSGARCGYSGSSEPAKLSSARLRRSGVTRSSP